MPETVDWRHGPPLDAHMPRTLEAFVADRVQRFADRTVLVDTEGRAWSWRDLDAAAARLAGVWRDRLRPGDRVALLLPNGAAHLVCELACWRLGLLPAPVYRHQPPERLARALALVEPALVVAASGVAVPSPVPVMPASAVLEADHTPAPWRTAGEDDPCLLLQTSGSGGTPRAVTLTRRNLCSQQAAFAQLWPEVGPADRLVGYLPWHHSFGALADRLWALGRGCAVHLAPQEGRDHAGLADTVRRVRPTLLLSVPKVHADLQRAGVLDLAALRWVFTAGARLGAREEAWYAERGVRVVEGWGLTETSPSATITPAGAPRVPGVVGLPIPGVAVGVRAGDGRLLVRGPNVMAGYFNDAAATARVLTDGVLDTGDRGAWTEQGLRLDGRADAVVKLPNGVKADVAAIESALLARPGVAFAAVGVDDDGLLAVLWPAAGDDGALRAAVAAVNAAEPVKFLRLRSAWRLDEAPTVANGLLTSSHKPVRTAALARLSHLRRLTG